MPTSLCEQVEFDTLLTVTHTDQGRKLVGTFNRELDTAELGWKLDINQPVAAVDEEFRNIRLGDRYSTLKLESPNRNHLYLPVISDPDRDTIQYDNWQPGVGEGDDLLPRHIRYTDLGKDFPIYQASINTGHYSIGPETHFLYSDKSIVQYVSPTNNQTDLGSGISYSQLELSDLPDMAFPVLARIYKRGTCREALIYRDFKHVDSFTGELSGSSRLATFDDDRNILWDNIDNRFADEYVIHITDLDTETIYILTSNKDATYTFALPEDFFTDLDYCHNSLECYLDCIGATTGRACQILYSTLLPLHNDLATVRIYLHDANAPDCSTYSLIDEWTPVNTLDFSLPTDKHVLVDTDLGLFIFGGKKADPTVLCEDVLITDEILHLLDASAFSERGIVRISDPDDTSIYEDITYYGKDNNDLLNVVRGGYGTTAIDWPACSIVEERQKGLIPDPNLSVCVAYTAVPRVEYEPLLSEAMNAKEMHQYRPVLVTDVDLNPVRNSESEGLLYLHRCPNDIARLVISVLDKPQLTGDSTTYGPVYIGPDYATMKVCALNADGFPIPGAKVLIDLEGIGLIAGSNDLQTFYTGSDGCFTFVYKSPTNPEDLGTYSTIGYTSGANTVLEFDENADFSQVELDDIYLYTITKDSALLGTVGYSGTVFSVENSLYLGGTRTAITAFLDIEPGFFNGGQLILTYSDGYIVTRDIELFTTSHSGEAIWDSTPMSPDDIVANSRARTFHFGTALPAGTVSSYRALQADSVEWESGLLNGRRTIVYRLIDQEALTHPSMDLDTVYGPLRPINAISNRSLTYSGSLDLPDPVDPNVNLGAYWSASPRTVRVRAYTHNTLCDSGIIFSGEVKLKVDLPPSMLGVYVAGNLRVPYGFRLLSENFDAASVLNALTFLTINTVGRFGSAGPFISSPADGALVLSTDTYTGPSTLDSMIIIT